jgi:hypothetical protein
MQVNSCASLYHRKICVVSQFLLRLYNALYHAEIGYFGCEMRYRMH